jgi:predicted transcriptional regulator
MRAISLKIPEELDRRLTEFAARRKVTRSAVLREALEVFTADSSRSFTSLAGDLAGSLSGPRDLSTSSAHMTDYGK